jgi:hypothetical protein
MEYQADQDINVNVEDVEFEALDMEMNEIKEKLNQIKGIQIPVRNNVNLEKNHWCIVEDWIQCPIGVLQGGNEVVDLSLDSSFNNVQWLHENGMLYIPVSTGNMGYETTEPEKVKVRDDLISIF